MRPDETIGRYPHQLSGGQRQRVMVARALIIKPSIILADEPVSMIDASLRATVLGSLQRLKEEFGISILYITHDLTTAFQIGDNIIVLYRGSVTEAGGVEEVVQQPSHPYTQLLVGSIPNPDPDHPWAAEDDAAFAGQKRGEVQRASSSDRCPVAMDEVPARDAAHVPDGRVSRRGLLPLRRRARYLQRGHGCRVQEGEQRETKEPA